MDVLKLFRAASADLREIDYQSHLDFFTLAPAANLALSFEQARLETDRWVRLHCLRDAIDIVSAFLEDAHRVCGLYRLIKTEGATVADLQRWERQCKQFHSLGLPRKIALLKESFGVDSDFDAHILSLNDARNCLVHRLGTVTERETNGAAEFRVRWMEIGIEATSPDGATIIAVDEPRQFEPGWRVATVLRPHERAYRLGDRLDLTYRDLLGAVFSHQNYINNLTLSVERYARSIGIEFLPDKDA